ncbi:hypothetical protein Tco_0654516 [Tanacetum coccineum]|uniref:Uncharacterized protein n=1 Tax=Tanacetum coccineum TaxID=301880 RepID=A0ABQ4X3F4_9ASTR
MCEELFLYSAQKKDLDPSERFDNGGNEGAGGKGQVEEGRGEKKEAVKGGKWREEDAGGDEGGEKMREQQGTHIRRRGRK